MNDSLVLEGFREALAGGQAVIVAGAGVAIATTQNAPSSSWLGLIKDGIAYVEQHDKDSGKWRELVELQLAQSLEDADQLLAAASQIAQRIKKMGDQAFASWIEKSVGALKVADPSWIEALLKVGAPIFTTNYDSLFELLSKGVGCDWQDASSMQRVLTRQGGVGHLHGRASSPESIILSEADYERVKGFEPAQALQQAMSASRSIVYVGCGDTLSDPNFSRLLAWHRQLFPVSGVTHYRLCREGDFAELTELHRNDPIEPVSYGAAFADLPDFLNEYVPAAAIARSAAGVVRDATGEAREYIADQIREETIVGESRLDRLEAPLESLLVAPVLLPVPQGEFFQTRRPDEARPARVDAYKLLEDEQTIMVVAEPGGGLSTALRWLLLRRSNHDKGVAPISVDFRKFPSGVGPLSNVVKLEAFHRGLIGGRKEDVPHVTVAIDNFHGHSNKSGRTVEELAEWSGQVLVGVNTSFEAEALELFKAVGVEPRTVYLGKMGASEVREMATLASPAYAGVISAGVMTTLQYEHLPRTPFNVALLVAILMRGESLVANASPTAVLEQYVSHLLGRDEAEQDSYFSLTSTDRESILTDLATMFVEGDQGSVLQSDAVLRMEQFFDRFAWSESPADILHDIVRRRVLSYDGKAVRFTQSSFLHLFAAKSATRNDKQRALLVERPLYYTSVLRAYASLVRHDAALLSQLRELVVERDMNPDSIAYSKDEPDQAPEDLEERLRAGIPSEAELDGITDASIDHPFDSSEDQDILPFPATTEEDLSDLARSIQSVDLVSAVLRDSEEVDDLELKRETLLRVLRGWGQVIEQMSDDEAFAEVISSIRDSALGSIDSASLGKEELQLVEDLARIVPPLFVSLGIEAALASRKLILLLDRLIDDGEIADDPRIAIPAAMLLYAIREPRWETKFDEVLRKHDDLWNVRRLLNLILDSAFFDAEPGSESERRLVDISVANYLKGLKFESGAKAKAVGEARREQLLRLKRLRRERLERRAVERLADPKHD